MTIDFFQPDCRELTNEALFGIRDGEGEQPAYMSINPDEKWVAIVHNQNGTEVNFHAIDGCVKINRPDGTREKRCDVLLNYPDNIVFIELKEQDKNWIARAAEQMRQTIMVFSAYHNLSSFRRRRAFLANRTHPHFQFSHKEEMERFKAETSVRLIIHNEIKI